ncbi:MFS transporter [Mycobacterium asiaticum DSM 44297]|nr:MFS transporter [Mycobacterium asiaticum DSM 44297]
MVCAPVSTPTLRTSSETTRLLFAGVLATLLAMGWAASHFTALMPALGAGKHLSAATLDVIFGVYAIGLLPGLLVGGRASDIFGRASVALVGSLTVLLGTVAMLPSQESGVLMVGRLIVGLGVGLAVSSCTSWASDLHGSTGAALAGAVLMAGFAVGPFASGAIASIAQSGVRLSFAVAAGLVAVAMIVAVGVSQRAAPVRPEPAPGSEAPGSHSRRLALGWAMPLAPWVFASASVAFVTIPTKVHTGLAAPLAAGVAALITNGASGVIQLVARSRRWGPQTGTVGALLAALGYAALAVAPSSMPLGLGLALVVLLGCASGLCLREGLIDVEAAAPQQFRGTLTGIFYAVTYVGFGLPLLLTVLGPGPETALIFAALAALATTAALSRAVRLRRHPHRQHRVSPATA